MRVVFGEETHDGKLSLINPGRPIPPSIIDLTGISDEMVKGAPGEDSLHEYFDFIGDGKVYAYNADFDMSFLRAAAKRLGRTFKNESRCVLELLRERHRNLRSYKLADACMAFGINPSGLVHRAEGDVTRTIQLYGALCAHREPSSSYLRQSRFDDADGAEEYDVLGHFNEAGECFYVRTVNGSQSEIPDKDTLWSFYTQQMLNGKYEIRVLDEELSFKKALAIKEKLLKKHANTVLNRRNEWRECNAKAQDRYREIKGQIENLLNSGKVVEKTDPDEALIAYRRAFQLGEEQLDLLLEDGLFGEVDRAYGKIHRCNPLVKAVDRITLVLCRDKRYDEAAAVAEDLFSRYPGANLLAGAETIRNRVSKGISKIC